MHVLVVNSILPILQRLPGAYVYQYCTNTYEYCIGDIMTVWPAGASNLPRDEGNAVLPSQAGEHQLIRLPGQTRVSPEEYKEFLGLGHGDVFDLDPDR